MTFDALSYPIVVAPGLIGDLQDYVIAKIRERGFDDETSQETILLFAEESGELIKAYNRLERTNLRNGERVNETAQVASEIVDVINLAFAVAYKLGIDMETVYREQEARIDQRRYEKRLQNMTAPDA